jgi:hypothetical protein
MLDLNQQLHFTAPGVKCRIMDGPISCGIIKRASMISVICTSVTPSSTRHRKYGAASMFNILWQSSILCQQAAAEEKKNGFHTQTILVINAESMKLTFVKLTSLI